MIAQLSSTLKDVICKNQPELIERNLTESPGTTRKAELQACLDLAMPEGSIDTIRTLLDLGAELWTRSLASAVAREEPEIFQALVDSGWDINSTPESRAAIHFAVRHEASLRWLLSHGADPDLKSRQVKGSCSRPSTPLAQASRLSDPNAVHILLSHGAKMDPEAIFHAIDVRGQRNGTVTLHALIDHGADVNYVSKRWWTPLHHAVHRAGLEKVRVLLERGADQDFVALGVWRSAYESAKARGRVEMCEYMEGVRSLGAP